MERRKQKRLKFLRKATLLIDTKPYAGFIEDVSIDGIKYVVTAFLNTPENFSPRRQLQCAFQLPSGAVIRLSGELVWFTRLSPSDKELTVGIKLVDPPIEFREFVASLS